MFILYAVSNIVLLYCRLIRQANYMVSKCVHTAKCQFYTARITQASSSEELRQVVNTLSTKNIADQLV